MEIRHVFSVYSSHDNSFSLLFQLLLVDLHFARRLSCFAIISQYVLSESWMYSHLYLRAVHL